MKEVIVNLVAYTDIENNIRVVLWLISLEVPSK